jgi:hypothetical protein
LRHYTEENWQPGRLFRREVNRIALRYGKDRTVFAPRTMAAAGLQGRLTMKSFVVRLGTLAATGALAGLLALASAGAAAAAGNPNGTGQPSQSCQAEPPGSTPGNSANAPGSAFNPNGQAGSVYAGTQPQNSNNPNSVAQYDVACYQQAQH